jgi:hypothetical protein
VAMDEFMTRTNCFEGIYKKRSSVILGYDEKRIFHSAIANFFSINTDETVNNLDQLNMFLVGNTASYDFQMIDHEKDPSLDKVKLYWIKFNISKPYCSKPLRL